MFSMLDKWLRAYVCILILILIYGIVSWCLIKMVKLFVFLFAVLFSLLVYAISFCFGKLLKGRVVPIFARKG